MAGFMSFLLFVVTWVASMLFACGIMLLLDRHRQREWKREFLRRELADQQARAFELNRRTRWNG